MARSNPTKRFSAWFSEVQRRRVFRTAAFYLAGAWISIEVYTTVFELLGLPDWTPRALLFGLIALFPFVIAMSWFFDIGVHGMERTKPLDPMLVGGSPQADAHLAMAALDKPAAERSIAILPFDYYGRDADGEYLGEGIAAELLHRLAQVPGVTVAARTSSMAFKGKDLDARYIASRLGVRHLLGGSVRQTRDRLRIAAELVDASSGLNVWSQIFDRPIDDIFDVQDDIAESIFDAMRDTLDARAPAKMTSADPPTANIEAYQSYLRARFLWQKRGEMALRGAIGALQDALERDPAFAQAYALLAACHAVLHEYCDEPREEGFSIAEPLARKAIVLDAQLSEAHAVLGYIRLRLWRWESSERHLTQAIELNQQDPVIHQWHSNLLNDLGRLDEALAAARRAYEIDRLSPMANNVLALNYLLHGDNDRSQRHTKIAREFGIGGIVPDYVDFFVFLRNKEWDRATDVWQKAVARGGHDTAWVPASVNAMKDPQQLPAALAALNAGYETGEINASALFVQYILLRQTDAVFDLAQTRLADHSLVHTWLMMPEARALRESPRFLRLMNAMGLESYWRAHGWPPLVAGLADDTQA